MKSKLAIYGLVLGATLLIGVAQAGLGDLFKSAEGLLDQVSGGSVESASALTDRQIGDGLKEALRIGAERAVELLGRRDGFLNDASVRIPLPGLMGSVAKGLRAAGQGQYVDNFETTINRAAEEAIPQTLAIVQQTVSDMTLEDVRGILSGGDDAATRFLRERVGGSLRATILPIVARATDNAGATAAYKSLKAKGDGMLGGLDSLAGLIDTRSLDLDGYVADKTMEGLFLKLAAEEKRIRENPVARTTDILKTVFGG